MAVTVFPSPAGVGVIAVTKIYLPFFLSFNLSKTLKDTLAIYFPSSSSSSSFKPSSSAISKIGLNFSDILELFIFIGDWQSAVFSKGSGSYLYARGRLSSFIFASVHHLHDLDYGFLIKTQILYLFEPLIFLHVILQNRV